MSIRNEEDNFDNLINSLKPIEYKFSNQSLRFDKIFNKLNLEELEKKLHEKGKHPATFKDSLLYKKVDEIYDLSGACYDYFEDMNGIKKMPIKVGNRGPDYVKHLYNPEFEKKIDELMFDKKEEETKMYRKEEIKFYQGIKQPSFGLDPGYYHPNYNYVKKRIPSFNFGKTKKFYNYNDRIKESEKNIKENQDIKENITEENKNIDKKNDKIIDEHFKIKNANLNNQLLKQNLNNIKNKTIFKIQSRNPKNLKNKNKTSITQKSFLPTIDKDKTVGRKLQPKKLNQKECLKKATSTPNIISFKKMRGRDDVKKKVNNNTSDIFYKPNYNYNSPHIPGFLFKSNNDKNEYKKYKIGKLLRSYIFDPYKYFVMDINENDTRFNSKKKIDINRNKNKKIKNRRHKNN